MKKITAINTRRVGSGYMGLHIDGVHKSNHNFESTAIQAAVN